MRFSRPVALLCTLFVLTPHIGAAQAVSGLSAAAADMLGTELIKKAKSAGSDLLNQGANHGNALLAQFGNQINVAAENAILLAGSDLGKAVKDMSTQNQLLMARLDNRVFRELSG